MRADSVVSQRSLVELLEAERDHYKQLAEMWESKHKLVNADYDDLKADFEVQGMELDRVNAELARATAPQPKPGDPGWMDRFLQTLADEAGES